MKSLEQELYRYREAYLSTRYPGSLSDELANRNSRPQRRRPSKRPWRRAAVFLVLATLLVIMLGDDTPKRSPGPARLLPETPSISFSRIASPASFSGSLPSFTHTARALPPVRSLTKVNHVKKTVSFPQPKEKSP